MLRIGMATGVVSLALLVACSSDDSKTTPSAAASTGMGIGGQAGQGGSTTADASTGGSSTEAGPTPDAAGTGDGPICGSATCPPGALCTDGACACPSYKPGMCADGCADLKVDPDHCGSCSTQCAAGAPCDDGACGPAPDTVVPSSPGCDILSLALANGRLYWTDKGHGTVASVSTTDAGATPVPLATGQGAPRSLLVAGGAAYWIDGRDNTVKKATLGDAGAPTTLVTVAADAGDEAIGAIAVSGTTLYYAVVDKIYKTLTTGGAATLVGTTQQGGVASALAFDSMNLYYPTKLHNDVEIMALTASADGGSQTSRIAESQGGLYFDNITVIGSQAYWANNEALRTGSTNHGLNTTNVASTANFSTVTGFVIGATHAYLGEAGAGAEVGFVEKAPLDVDAGDPTGAARIIARGQRAPNSIVLDTAKVYWSTRDVGADAGGAPGCTIMSRTQ